jgi:hypothetical protein
MRNVSVPLQSFFHVSFFFLYFLIKKKAIKTRGVAISFHFQNFLHFPNLPLSTVPSPTDRKSDALADADAALSLGVPRNQQTGPPISTQIDSQLSHRPAPDLRRCPDRPGFSTTHPPSSVEPSSLTDQERQPPYSLSTVSLSLS